MLQRSVVTMRKIVQQIKAGIMSVSLQERKKREYKCFEEKISQLKSLSDMELKAEYISAKIKYEHHQNILLLFLVSIVLAILMNAWKYFADFLNRLLQLLFTDYANANEIATIGFIISTIVISIVTVTVLFILIVCVKKSSSLHRQLLMIEDVKCENEKAKKVNE